MVTEKADLAWQLFLALASKPDFKVTPTHELGRNEIEVCFMLADTFIKVRKQQA